MRITFYAHRYLPFAGGVETATTHLARHLVARGHEVTIATTTPTGAEGYPPARMVHAPSRRELLRLFRGSDVIQMQGFALGPMMLALRSKTPLVWGHHDHDLRCPKAIAWWDGDCEARGPALKCFRHLKEDHPLPLVATLPFMLSVRRAFARHPRIHHFTASDFVRHANGPHARNRTLRYGLVLGAPHPATPEPPVATKLVFVGRLIDEKGADVLLRALATPEVRALAPTLSVIGGGPARGKLERLAHELGIEKQVSFTGPLPGPAVRQHMLESTAVVVPSVWDEPYGIVALEGMDAGAVVVASAVGGLREIAMPGGLTFPRGDADALAGALVRVMTDPTLRADARQRGTEVARAHGWERISAEYERFYQDVRAAERLSGAA